MWNVKRIMEEEGITVVEWENKTAEAEGLWPDHPFPPEIQTPAHNQFDTVSHPLSACHSPSYGLVPSCGQQ